MAIPMIEDNQVFENLTAQKNSFYPHYYAFYSSWFGGIIKNPRLMLLPIDDHIVHRGDGVFEAMKSVSKKVYLMDQHLERLFLSAEKLAITPFADYDQIKKIIFQTLQAANQDDSMIRVYLSRGPGGFSVNPYDAEKSQLYIIITQLNMPALKIYESGVVIGLSHIFGKSSWMAQVKSCNYLPNVLMKKEAVDRGIDFVIGLDQAGYVTESATENIMILDENETLIHPPFENILKGTTMIRACELARENNIATEIRSISIQDLQSAKEIMMAGTTLNIMPVVKYENHVINTGKPGPIAKKLNKLILEDIKSGKYSIAY